ncbi:MAG: TolC family protein [Candidatus Azobacteroides sp.]|nr:TolC family protein [Candidatus Azobacteroides sp.]
MKAQKILTIFLLLIVFQSATTGLQGQTNNLNYYINRSLENSPLLKDYQNQMIINQMDSLILRATYKPQVNFSSTGIYPPIIKGIGYDEAITNGGNYSALLTVSQTIIGGGNKKTRLNTYTLENQSVRNAKKISEQDLKLSVTTQYIATYGILQEIVFNEEIKNLLTKESILLKTLTERAIYKQTDYLNFQVTLQQQQLLINQQKADYKNNMALLNYLCGIVDTSFVRLEKPDITLRPSLSFENTLQYFNFQIDSLKIQNSNALIDYEYRPKLDVFADAGFNSSFAFQPYKNFGASIGLSLVVPIYDGGQRQKQHNKIKASEQTRQNYQDFSRQQYRQQSEQLYQQLEQTESIIYQAQTVIKSTQVLIDAYGKLLQTGDVAITDYILSINNFLNAKHVITQQTNNKLQIINQINYWNFE